MKTKTLLTAILMIGIMNLYCQIINVPGDQPTIQAGIDAAATGDTVLVAQGIYFENINFNGKAITVASHYHYLMNPDSANIYNTIIDGSQPANPDYGSVVTFITGEDTTSVLSGFTITGGSGMYLSSDDARIGGGIVCYYASAKIIHNIIEGNEVNYSNHAWGAGIASIKESGDYWTVVTDNIVRDNQAIAVTGNSTGGGMEIWGSARIYNNCIEDNHCISESGFSVGGGVVSVSINNPPDTLLFENNVVVNNSLETNNWCAGGGLDVENAYSVITNNIFEYNTCEGSTESHGGGIKINQGETTINFNTIRFNQLTSNDGSLGGGVSMWYCDSYLDDNEICYNSVSAIVYAGGGGVHFYYPGTIEFENNLICDNQASSNTYFQGAGVVCLFPTAYMNFRYNEFSNNSGPVTFGAGGGMYIVDAYDNEVIIEANLFLNNTACFGGGFNERLCNNLLLTNNLFSGNTSYGGGGINLFHPETKAIKSSNSQDNYRPQVINNTFDSNSASSHAGALRFNGVQNAPVILNCIFSENEAPDGKDIRNMGSDSLFINYSNIDTVEINNHIVGLWTGANNIYADPEFIDDSCHIYEYSPCKDAGVDSLEVAGIWYYAPETDYEGDPRPLGEGIDMGVDEYDIIPKVPNPFVAKVHEIVMQENRPNPFSDHTFIEFKLPRTEKVTLKIFDLTGREIETLNAGHLSKGDHSFILNSKNLKCGI
ncbi:MAG: hypothetical protein K8R74_09630, partial [Bacteroidales bacterium]|nr:hypothetical protein [Bacteroidales bacterium]